MGLTPESVIRNLIDEMRETRARNLAVAIAELAYLQTRRVNAYDAVATGTVVRYSYAYLFDPKLKPEREEFDAQFRGVITVPTSTSTDDLTPVPIDQPHGDKLTAYAKQLRSDRDEIVELLHGAA